MTRRDATYLRMFEILAPVTRLPLSIPMLVEVRDKFKEIETDVEQEVVAIRDGVTEGCVSE